MRLGRLITPIPALFMMLLSTSVLAVKKPPTFGSYAGGQCGTFRALGFPACGLFCKSPGTLKLTNGYANGYINPQGHLYVYRPGMKNQIGPLYCGGPPNVPASLGGGAFGVWKQDKKNKLTFVCSKLKIHKKGLF